MTLVLQFLGVCIAGLIIYRRWQEELSLRRIFWPALACKLVAAIAVGMVYMFYYDSGDTFVFFQDGSTLTEWGKRDPVEYGRFLWSGDEHFLIWKSIISHEPRTLFFSKIVSLVNFVTGSNYWITSLYFSLISFFCSIVFVRIMIYHFPESKWAAVISCMFIPSVVFWGSGVIKECVAMASLFFLGAVFLRIMKQDRMSIRNWILAFISGWMLWHVKYYCAAVFLIVAATSITVVFGGMFFGIKKIRWLVLLWFIILCAPLYIVSISVENFRYENFFNVIVQNYEAYKHLPQNGTAIQYGALEPNGWSLLYHAPWALISGLFRPFIWEAHNMFQVLVALENMVLFFLILSSMLNLKQLSLLKSKMNINSTDCIVTLTTIVYVTLLCIFLALSTPNFGTLSRYRICFLPFLFFLVLYQNAFVNRILTFMQRSFFRLVR